MDEYGVDVGEHDAEPDVAVEPEAQVSGPKYWLLWCAAWLCGGAMVSAVGMWAAHNLLEDSISRTAMTAALVMVLWKGTGGFVRWARRSDYRMGLATGLTLLLAAPVLLVSLGLGVVAWEKLGPSEEFQLTPGEVEELSPEVEAAAAETPPDKASAAEVLDRDYRHISVHKPSPWSADRFEDCVKWVYEHSGGMSEREQALRRLARKNSPDMAEDLVQAAILQTCEHHAKKPKDDLGPYFNVVLRNVVTHRYSRSPDAYDRCPILPFLPDERGIPTNPTPGSRQKIVIVQNAMCRLDDADRQLIEWAVDGFTAGEMASMLGCKEATARKRLSRARRSLKNIVEERHPDFF